MKKAVLAGLQVAFLYGIYQLGNGIAELFGLFIPGSIIGMLLLFGLLISGVVKTGWFDRGASFLLSRLPFLFIPVTVGVMNYLDLFTGEGLLAVAAVLVSTALVMTGGGWISQETARRKERMERG
ncbi:CidA/LrgA family protein [Bacillus marinisedimentorum]|uniref:CidA/LrgA family protein n=1 Tax=Bacillus marinisedimentorum TaxID=1821260 RepID=UPI00087256F2|nr:CidA/LrgA family protein [Bacillus marinisedimentorum]